MRASHRCKPGGNCGFLLKGKSRFDGLFFKTSCCPAIRKWIPVCALFIYFVLFKRKEMVNWGVIEGHR